VGDKDSSLFCKEALDAVAEHVLCSVMVYGTAAKVCVRDKLTNPVCLVKVSCRLAMALSGKMGTSQTGYAFVMSDKCMLQGGR
jgi:hypothetical protein